MVVSLVHMCFTNVSCVYVCDTELCCNSWGAPQCGRVEVAKFGCIGNKAVVVVKVVVIAPLSSLSHLDSRVLNISGTLCFRTLNDE